MYIVLLFFFYTTRMCEECSLLIIYMYIMNLIKIFCITALKKKKFKVYELCLPATLAIQCMYRYVKYRFSNTALINSIHLLWCVEYSPATLAMQRIGEEETLKVSSISPGLLASMTDTWVWEPELWEIHTREDICSFSASFRPFSWSCQTKPKISSYLSLWFCCCPFFIWN